LQTLEDRGKQSDDHPMKVFWSWQADTPGNVGRFFVRDALAEVIKALKTDEDIAICSADARPSLMIGACLMSTCRLSRRTSKRLRGAQNGQYLTSLFAREQAKPHRLPL
jgi:hypothetical protein